MITLRFLQPALPSFRRQFYQHLAKAAPGSLRVVYSASDFGVLTAAPEEATWARAIGSIRELPFGMMWQCGALSIELARGDILVLWGNPRCLSTLALALRARWCGVKVVWWGHYWSSTSRKWRLALRMSVARVAHALLFYTDREVAEYRAGVGARDKRPIAALNNGLDTSDIRALRKLHLPQERGRELLFIGRLTEKCRLGLLLDALADPRLALSRLNVIGAGAQEEAWRKKADALGLGDRIVWHAATTDEAVIAPIANRCRLFVYPGEVGLSLIHGMAYGLPSVVHADRWKHMPEIAAFEEGVTGRAFARENPEDLARIIAGLLDVDATLRQMSERCIAVTDDSFNTEDMVTRFLRLLEQLK
jgi:glycosyltransferase involved in cell wall biosynthesis